MKLAKTMLFVALAALFVFVAPACGDDDDGEQPEITGCNTVEYKGCTYGDLGCQPGLVSFDLTITQGECEASFHIECGDDGCVSDVTAK